MTTPAQQTTQPEQGGNLGGVVAGVLAAGGAVTAGLAPAAAGVVPVVALALGAAAIAKLTAEIIKNTSGFMAGRVAAVAEGIQKQVAQAYPQVAPDKVAELVREELRREAAFRRKMATRLQHDIPEALALEDPDARRDALKKILEREQRYMGLREEAMTDRAMMAAEHDVVRALSPKGAFWKLSPLVMTHTPDCIALGDKWWPWKVIDAVGGPPRHPGCRCQLLTEQEAVEADYMDAGYADGVDVADALTRAKKALKDAGTIMETCSDDEWQAWLVHLQEDFVSAQHPRSAIGQFVDKAISVAAEKGVDVKRAFHPGDASPARAKTAEYRMQAASAILASHAEIPDAVLYVDPEPERRKAVLDKIVTGDASRAFLEYSTTPVADLEILSHVFVDTKPVHGQANANLATRALNMGSTSVTGDFRHELGHALRAAFGGLAYNKHTELTKFVALRHDETMARVKQNIKLGLPKPKTHEEWETKIGVIDPRGLDNWEEDFAEHYRAYHKAVYQTTNKAASDHNPEALKTYRERFPQWARLWDAWYTAQIAGRSEMERVKSLGESHWEPPAGLPGSSQTMAELWVRDIKDGSYAPESHWDSAGEFLLAPGAARLQVAVKAAQDSGKTWITLDAQPHRYNGKCSKCKRPASLMLRERVALGQRDGKPYIKRNPVDLDHPNEDPTETTCIDCGAKVRTTRLKGVFKPSVVCDKRCTGARGSNCECSCGGANHGSAWGMAEALIEGADMNGAMIALYPTADAAGRIARRGGEAAKELHVTLKYLGPDHEELGDEMKAKLHSALKKFASSEAPVTAKITGVGTFKPKGEDEKPVIAHVSAPGIQGFRERLLKALPDGVMEDSFPDFKPHMTLRYIGKEDEPDDDVPKLPLQFDAVHLVIGGEKFPYKLGGASATNDKIEEAAWDRRFPKGTHEGGRYMPRVGGVGSPLKRALLHRLFPELPRLPKLNKRGVEHDLNGRRVFVPTERAFQRRVNGRTFHSPAGSDHVYAMPHIDPPHADVAPETIEDLERLRGDKMAGIDAAIAVALETREKGTPPVRVGQSGWSTDGRLRQAGFIETKVASSPGGLVFDYLAPDGRSTLSVTYDKEGSTVARVLWDPRDPPVVRQLGRPPKTWNDFAEDTMAYAHDLGRQVGSTVTVNKVEAWDDLDPDHSDHSGEHQWDGTVLLGRDIPKDLMTAAVARKLGHDLTRIQKRRVFASMQASTHEALHGVNPQTKDVYSDGPNMVLEEALTEELSFPETVKRLRQQGQDDVVQWAADHPTDTARLGTYISFRVALDDVLNDAGISPERRESYIRRLKLRTPPAERVDLIAGDVSRNLGIDHEDAFRRVTNLLMDVGKPSTNQPLSGSSRFIPILGIDAKPSESRERFELGGAPLGIGDWVTVNRHVRKADGDWVDVSQTGRVRELNEQEEGDWTATVGYGDGVMDYAVFPRQIRTVESHDYDRSVLGAEAQTLQLPDGEIRTGSMILYGKGDVQARVVRILRDVNPHDLGHKDAWAVEAVTTSGGVPVILTQERTGGLLRPDGGELDLPSRGGGTVALTVNQKAAVQQHFDLPAGTRVVPTPMLATGRPPKAADVIAEKRRLLTHGGKRPPLQVLPREDGKLEVFHDSDALHAARQVGMSHVPVHLVQVPRGDVLALIDRDIAIRQEAPGSGEEHGRAMVQGLRAARDIVARGGGQPEILDAAFDAGPLRGGSVQNEGFQDGMRSAWLSHDQAAQEHMTKRYSGQLRPQARPGEAPTLGKRVTLASRGVAVDVGPSIVNGEPDEGVREMRLEDGSGSTYVLARVIADLPETLHRDSFTYRPGDRGQARWAAAARRRESSSSGQAKWPWEKKPFDDEPDVPKMPAKPTPFDVTALKSHERALVLDMEGQQWKVEWGKNKGQVYLDPVDGKPAIAPIKVEDLPPGLMFLGLAPKQQYEAPLPPKPKTDDSGQVTTTKPAGGSNGAMMAVDKEGVKWLVKSYRGDQDRIATELLANAIYRELGVKVPNAGELDFDGVPALAYPLLDGEPKQWTGEDPTLGEGFMADALLANWDVVGLSQDNVLWDEDGVPFRVDQGGTLQYRAQGQIKPFGPVPSEVWSMNSPGGQAFGTMQITPASKKKGAREIKKRLTPARIDSLVDAAPFKNEKMREEVREALKARVAWMGDYATGKVKEPEPARGMKAVMALAGSPRKPLTPEELLATDAWAGGWDALVNDHLRTGASKEKASKELKFLVKAFDQLTREGKAPEDMEAWSVLPASGLPKGGVPKLEGATIMDKGFKGLVLTSPPISRRGDVRVRLKIPKGTSLCWLRGLPDHPLKAGPDLVLPRSSRARIVRITETDAGVVLDAVLI
jgi:2'-5' RNA ligase